MDNTEVFLMYSATVNLYGVSDGDSEMIAIDSTTQQQLRTMNISVNGN